MDANNVQEGVRDLTQKLITTDQVTSNAAINQYFDGSAVVDSITHTVNGADRIKKQADLVNNLLTGTHIVGEPTVNDEEKTADFVFTREFTLPKIPIFGGLPIIRRFSGAKKVVTYDAKLHLNPDGERRGENDTPMLLVTKFDMKRRERAPLENLIPYYVLRPILGPASNVIATVSRIVLSSPFTPRGLITMASQAGNSFVEWSYGKWTQRKQKSFTEQEWADHPDANLPNLNGSLSSRAYTTATNVGQAVEARARRAGLPVDQVKDTVAKTAENLKGRAQHLRGQADQAKEKVEQTATDATTNDESSGNEQSPNPGNNDPNAQPAPSDDLPQTPLGGTDPLADGAPSYAQATAE